jgi:hypothetical protein
VGAIAKHGNLIFSRVQSGITNLMLEGEEGHTEEDLAPQKRCGEIIGSKS